MNEDHDVGPSSTSQHEQIVDANSSQVNVNQQNVLLELTRQAQDLDLYDASDEARCRLCSSHFKPRSSKMSALKLLSYHVKSAHGMSALDYTINVLHSGTQPHCACEGCDESTRYVGFSFKKYCKAHSFMAESEAGHVGGRIKKTWNKGQTKKTNPIIARIALEQSGEGNAFFGKKHSSETLDQIASSKRLPFEEVVRRIKATCQGSIVLSNEDEYLHRQNATLRIKCMKCETISDVSLFNAERCWRCRTCFPNASKPQLEIADFVKSLGAEDVEISTRSVISPLELDIWIPSKKLAVEYHGLYWHSGGSKPDQFVNGRHRAKYVACRDAGIRLIQIFSDEWENRNIICRSILRNALGQPVVKLNARDCTVEKCNVATSRAFLEMNHMDGPTRAKLHYVMKHPEHGIVGCMTFRSPFQHKKFGDRLEIARMAMKLDHSVRGGASKILSFALPEISSISKTLMTYADLRFGEGRVYESCGFTRQADTGINYGYTDGLKRENRFMYKARHDLGMTEKMVVEKAGVRRIEGCGNAVYVRML